MSNRETEHLRMLIASKRGIFAYITDSDVEEWQSAIDIVLRRFAEYHDLEARSAAER